MNSRLTENHASLDHEIRETIVTEHYIIRKAQSFPGFLG